MKRISDELLEIADRQENADDRWAWLKIAVAQREEEDAADEQVAQSACRNCSES